MYLERRIAMSSWQIPDLLCAKEEDKWEEDLNCTDSGNLVFNVPEQTQTF